MIVTVSSERETEGWPPDPACWFLVRPFGAEDVLRALRAPVPPGPSARAPLATRRRGAGREAEEPHRPGGTEPVVVPGARAPEPVTRLSTDDSLWGVDSGGAQPPAVAPPVVQPPVVPPVVQPPVAPPVVQPPVVPPVVQPPVVPPVVQPPVVPAAVQPAVAPPVAEPPATLDAPRLRSRRTLAEVVGALVLVIAAGLGGMAFGRANAAGDRLDVSPISTVTRPSTPSPSSQAGPPTTREQILTSAAPCLSALDHSDAAISYLVGNVRDDRLSKSIQQYQVDRRVCRERVR